MTKPVVDPLLGRTVAQYDILARVGGGAMGVVYKARDRKLERVVALKFLPQQWSHDETAKQRFVREAQAASATNHPNICTIHDIETADDGQLFIVMAHYEGPTLKQRLEAGALPVEEALDIATQIADGLAKAHGQGVVHRDIKPGNVILTEDGVRILDFGLATFADALKLTTENATLGTAAYMSPEQVRGQASDARTDVWAVGVVLYEMLVGHVPFQGSHAEAIGYAVRNEAPAPLRTVRPEASEEVEQLVFRALHKEPSVRYQSGRELARALRQIRGLTVPQEFRTQTVQVPADSAPMLPAARQSGRRHRAMAMAAALILCGGVMCLWLWWPAERAQVAVVPVVNQTGYAELDAYRLALTEELASQLVDLKSIRVLPHERLLQIVRPFRQEGRDVSSREALQAIATHSGARVLIVPTLLREDGGWKVRLEFRNPETASNDGMYETPPVVSSLMKDAVYGLMAQVAREIDVYFTTKGPLRVSVVAALGRAVRSEQPSFAPRMATLDAAVSLEQGIDAYEQLEYAAARTAFANASTKDPRNPLPLAWRSRAAALMRQDTDAIDAADQARRLLTAETERDDRLFIEAVAAEARRDPVTAEERYRALIGRSRDEPNWLIELAGFQDRQGMTAEAITTYHEALTLDARLVRPHLELCRLYSPSRSNEPALAKQRGEQALAMYGSLGNRSGEAQSHWCLTDVLLVGDRNDRAQARQHAETALAIMTGLGYPFGLARAYNYVANVAFYEGHAAEAAALWQQTLARAKNVGFVLLESRTLMNLGATTEALGRRSTALDYYRQSAGLSEALGSQQDAAWTQSNIATILIDYGDPEEGLRVAQDALAVLEKLSDKNFEVLARRAVAMYYRHVGRHDDAVRELTRARDIARGRDLDERATQMTLELARLRFDMNDYLGARDLLLQVEQRASGLNRIHARAELARTRARLGDFDAARADLARAVDEIQGIGDVGSLPLLYAARGEVAFESGRLSDARSHFTQAADLWTNDDLPEVASVESRAYVGLIDAMQGRPAGAEAAVRASLDQARRMRRVALEARCQVFLARVEVGAGRFAEALRRISDVSPERERMLGPELRAQLHYWRSQALAGRGDSQAAAAEAATAWQIVSELRVLVSEPHWANVLLRPDLRLLSELRPERSGH